MVIQLCTPPPEAYALLTDAILTLSTAGGAATKVTNVKDPSLLGTKRGRERHGNVASFQSNPLVMAIGAG